MLIRRIAVYALCLGLFQSMEAAEEPMGIIGGTKDTPNIPYATLVRFDGSLVPISPLPDFGIIWAVSMNGYGDSLMGGSVGTPITPYAALIGIDGQPISLTGLPINGEIRTVALNDQGYGLIGGRDENNYAYAAIKKPNKTAVTPLALGFTTDTVVYRVALNNQGFGLVGGIDFAVSTPFYAAFVDLENESVIPLTNLPVTNGNIQAVALADSKVGLVGGGSQVGFIYAGVVDPTGYVHELTFPSQAGDIRQVAVNQSGLGIIGGDNVSEYVAFVDLNTYTLTPIVPSNVLQVTSVAINEKGVGLFGGYSGPAPAVSGAAFVTVDSQQTYLNNLPLGLHVHNVSINDEGVGLIVGSVFDTITHAYAAIAAPNGDTTEITEIVQLIDYSMFSCDLGNNLLDQVVPEVYSSYLSAPNMQLAASFALNAHFAKNKRKERKNPTVGWLADASGSLKGKPCKEDRSLKNTIWVNPFWNFTHQAAYKNNPSYTNQIGGALLGFDHYYDQFLAGAALGYAYNYTQDGLGINRGNTQEEMAAIYGAYLGNVFEVHGALWSGIYQMTNKRWTLQSIASNSFTKGAIFAPHLEVNFPYQMGENSGYWIDPFWMIDWVNSWQNGFTETGKSGLNLVMPSQYTSILRNEVGVSFCENFSVQLGDWLFEEKLSYVNQVPFNFNPVTTNFVSSISTFPIGIGSAEVLNMGGVELRTLFTPKNSKIPYVSLDFFGEWGTSYQSYFVTLEVGRHF